MMVSVCIATYNGESFLQEQLLSILPQLGGDDEVIISDDGSTDSTRDIIRSMGDSRIRLEEGPCLGSPTWNFENALRLAKGDYIFLADQDNVWRGDKVRVCLRWLQDFDCVVSDAEMVDVHLNIIEKSYFGRHGTRPSRLYNLLWKNGYMGCCMAFSRRVLLSALPFPKDIPMHDIWIGNIAAYKYKVKFLREPLVKFRCHGNNASHTASGRSRHSLWQRVLFRYRVAKNLLR